MKLEVRVRGWEEIEIEFEGKKLSYAEYRKYSKKNILDKVHTTNELRKVWLDQKMKDEFIKELEGKKVNIDLIKSIDKLEDSDSFDVITHLAFDAPLLTREDRTKHFLRQNSQLIDRYGEIIKASVNEILDKYKYSGEENLSSQVFMLPNMYAKKQKVQTEFPNGLAGFLVFMKEKIYSTINPVKFKAA